MPLFSRSKAQPADPIEGFWQWWRETGAERLDSSIEGRRDYSDLSKQVSDLVTKIHPDLQWELEPGHKAKHAICVSAGGDASLRRLSERWLRSGPQADDTWEYASARRASPGPMEGKLDFGPWVLELDQIRLGLDVDEEEQRVSVSCFHPAFADMPENPRGQITFLVLDWLLGEDDVERWIGNVEAVVTPPPDDLPPEALPETVEALAGRHLESGAALLSAETPTGSPVLVLALRPMRWIDFPLFDQHIELSVTFDSQPNGLPTDDGLTAVRDFEDRLTSMLADTAVLTAHETCEGVRVLHYYADSEDSTASRICRQWAEERGVTVDLSLDPGWSAMRRYG
jgi:hypothetical protein